MKNPRLPTIEEMKEITNAPTWYKVAHIDDEEKGLYSSCFCGQPTSSMSSGCPKITYVVGMVSDAGDSKGIFCYSPGEIDGAVRRAEGDSIYTIEPPCTVLEVKPFGKLDKGIDSSLAQCVYVVGEYNAKEFKVGDRVKVRAGATNVPWGSHSSNDGKYTRRVFPESVGIVNKISGDMLVIDFPSHPGWYVQARKMELAPKPIVEWVDVTSECKLDWSPHGVIRITRSPSPKMGGHNSVGYASASGIHIDDSRTDYYKVEEGREYSYGKSFKILLRTVR